MNGARYSTLKTKDAYDKGKLSGHLSTSLYFLSKSLPLNLGTHSFKNDWLGLFLKSGEGGGRGGAITIQELMILRRGKSWT